MYDQTQFNSTPMIEASGVRKSFRNVPVLDGIALNVARGSVFALLGPNGAGKTTLVRILATLLKPDEGQVRIAGHDLRTHPEAVRRAIALTGQYAAVDELLTGEENLHMMGRLFHLSSGETQRRTRELLAQFDLENAARRMVKTYSGGMRRRLDLAISLLVVPAVLFLDEPTTGLDPRSRLVMWEIIRDLATSGVTIFLTTQYLEEADQLADRIAVLDNGRIIAEGTASSLKQRVGEEQLELGFARQKDITAARQIFGSQVLHDNEQKRSLRLAVLHGPKQIKQILDQMEQAAIEVETLELRKPTLDDAFFILTGRDTGGEKQNGG